MEKNTSLALLLGTFLVLFAIWYASSGSPPNNLPPSPTSVSIVNGVQIIEVLARGGYSPRSIEAKAGVPTVLKVKTQNTFDCSAALVIPQMSYRKVLSPSGTEEIQIPTEKAQGTLKGMCGMGMYGFEINFR